MTDYEKRQLLALAAKSIGATEYGGPDDCRAPGIVLLDGVPTHYDGHGEFGYAWNPLEDDADCARLAGVLEIDTHFRVVGGLRVEALPPGGPLVMQTYKTADERMQAWRYAVVRAAAEYQVRMNRGVKS